AQLVLVSVPRLPLQGIRSMSPGPDFRGADRERCVSYFTLLWWSKNTLSAMVGRRKRRMRCVGCSGDLLPPSPPPEKASARQKQAGEYSAQLRHTRQVSVRPQTRGWVQKLRLVSAD